jgi:hypothetical protein
MRRLLIVTTAILVVFVLGVSTADAGQATCTKIQDRVLMYSVGHYLDDQYLQTGFDDYGYNYQGRMFSGLYGNTYLGRDDLPPYEGDTDAYLAEYPDAANKWYWPYRDTQLLMKWNDAWLSNKDCDDDDLLDRHYGLPSYIGSGAWLTNHMSGTYEQDGKACHWTYFTKIVAAPEDAVLTDGVWYTAGGEEIGPAIWGQFATIQVVENDACSGIHGAQYVSPVGPGFGKW